MQIEIQSDILGTEKHLSEVNAIIHLALHNSSFANFKIEMEDMYFSTLDFGFGGSHCWVKQYDQFNELRHVNLLLIY